MHELGIQVISLPSWKSRCFGKISPKFEKTWSGHTALTLKKIGMKAFNYCCLLLGKQCKSLLVSALLSLYLVIRYADLWKFSKRNFCLMMIVLWTCFSMFLISKTYCQKGKQKSLGRATSRSRSQPLASGGREKVTQINVCMLTNKCTISTKTSSLFPKQGDQNAKRTEETHRQRAGQDQTWSAS